MFQDLIKKFRINVLSEYSLISTRIIPYSQKIQYIFRKYLSIILNKRNIKYLGGVFYYDNRYSPANLETYPKEIERIHKSIDLVNVKTVLDIGSNIGQFAYTIKKLFPHLKIYSFEPNKKIFPLLRKNIGNIKNIEIYDLGIGKNTEKRDFYFSPVASAEGSFYRRNMNQNFIRPNVEKIQVDIINLNPKKIKSLNIPPNIDLVKVDVEGAELEVLKSLKNLKFKYFYTEVSLKRKGANLREIKDTIEKRKNTKAKLIYYDLPTKDSPSANALFKISSKE